MKSKSPFAIKSPLRVQVYGGDTYESPDTVITKTVGEQVGKAITGIADNATKYMDLKGKLAYDKKNPKTETETATGRGNTRVTNITNNYGSNGVSGSNTDTDLNRRTEVLEEQGSGGFSGQSAKDLLGRNLTNKESDWKDDEVKRLGGVQQYRNRYKIGKEKNKFHKETTNKYETDVEGNERLIYSAVRDLSNPISMKGSPVKHNTGAAGAIGSDFSQAKNKYADIFGKSATTVGQNKQSGVGALQSFITQAKNQGGSMVGSVGQQIGNQAQQRAADAGGSTGVDPFLPPPNQVAETGSYGGGGDRILEMDSNPVGNQSIGRDTDITSQLFGSGQRASMLAMKGTPLHDKGHANDYEGHTHRKKGGSYKEGDYMDETDMETSYPKLHTQDVGEIKRDKKSQFMVSKNEDYSPTKIDTIRPLKGKEFKMGWGDAERNISTNPKYKKSN